MKSPKDILLEQHADAVPALDKIRKRVVAGLTEPERQNVTVFSFLHEAWLELFWRARHVWGGLATVWALLFVLSAAESGPGSPAPQSAQSPAPSMPVWERHQNALRAELGLPVEHRAQERDTDKSATIHQSRLLRRFENA